MRPLVVPCAVQAWTGANSTSQSSQQVEVQGAPATCGTAQLYLRLKELKWSEEAKQLRVQGDRAPFFARVEVWDAQTGALVAAAMADQSGKFDQRVRLDHPPCSVRIAIGGGAGA